jgi:chaperone modulatory protein CbpM
MEHREFLSQACLEAEVLEAWVAAGWLAPHSEGVEPQFTEIDVARVRLIKDLQGDVGVNDEGVGVILALIDQLHGMRRTLGDLLGALCQEPEEVRARLGLYVRRSTPDWTRPSEAGAQPAGDRRD